MFLSGFAILRLTVGALSIGFGIPGNIIIIAVFTRQSISNATDVAFIALAVVDLVGSVISGMKIAAVFFHDEHPWACFLEIIGSRSALFAGLFLTTSIAAYRYQAVCHPFGKRVGRWAAAWLSLTCTILAFAVHVPFFFITTSQKAGSGYICNIYGNIAWVRSVYSRSQAVLFCASALPVTALYVLILKNIRRHQKIRRKVLSDQPVSGPKSKPEAIGGVYTVSKSVKIASTSSNPPSDDFSSVVLDIQSANVDPILSQPSGRGPPPSRQIVDQAQTGARKGRKSDHKTTQMLIIITAVFFLLWLPSIILDQLSHVQIGHIASIISGTLLYFFYQYHQTQMIKQRLITDSAW
ncbi:uncharacterized protein [Diadema setosum]|uniref:uncharacterized protein n=1 Tax=Diadema setosum TaxID=31175 RepID=UPI003B3B4198